MKLFIGSLPYDITETELTDIFSSYGSVVSANNQKVLVLWKWKPGVRAIKQWKILTAKNINIDGLSVMKPRYKRKKALAEGKPSPSVKRVSRYT